VKNLCLLISLAILASCGSSGQDVAFATNQSAATVQGIESPSVGIDFADINPGLACANGGISIFSFYDSNSDKFFQAGETIIKTKAICNGLNGVDGISPAISLESFTTSSICPNGGIKISSSGSSPVQVCNGVDGINGAQGLQGLQGIPGMVGADGAQGTAGTVVTPVKFCTTDNATFPEYGLMIGPDLFAVYWGFTPAQPNVAQAFLTKIIAGNYISTGGNGCLFSIN
jgi:hypothetical protein